MRCLLVGSGAKEAWDILDRDGLDYDFICAHDQVAQLISTYGIVGVRPLSENKLVGRIRGTEYVAEIEIAWPGSTGEELLQLVGENDSRFDYQMINVLDAPLNVLYTLKLSHRYLKNSPHFLKTMRDIKEFRKAGATVPSWLEGWLKKRQKETLDYGHPKLDTTSKGFFTDNVPYKYVHDTIHLAMSRNGVPAYKLFQEDGAEVKVDRNKWNALSDDDRLASVIEEAYVLALERHQIPNDFSPAPVDSFKMALEKVCTSITSGWWREWAWEHYDEALKGYDPDYVGRCKLGIAMGTILPYKA